MTLNRICLIGGLVTVLLLVGCTGGSDDDGQGSGAGPLSLTLSTTDHPATLEVTLTNTSDGNVTVVRPAVTPNFIRFIVTDSDGAELPFMGAYKQLKPLSESGFADLDPGQSVSDSFDLSEFYEFSADEYSVAAEYRNPSGGTHEGDAALTFEPEQGITAASVMIEVGE